MGLLNDPIPNSPNQHNESHIARVRIDENCRERTNIDDG